MILRTRVPVEFHICFTCGDASINTNKPFLSDIFTWPFLLFVIFIIAGEYRERPCKSEPVDDMGGKHTTKAYVHLY